MFVWVVVAKQVRERPGGRRGDRPGAMAVRTASYRSLAWIPGRRHGFRGLDGTPFGHIRQSYGAIVCYRSIRLDSGDRGPDMVGRPLGSRRDRTAVARPFHERQPLLAHLCGVPLDTKIASPDR